MYWRESRFTADTIFEASIVASKIQTHARPCLGETPAHESSDASTLTSIRCIFTTGGKCTIEFSCTRISPALRFKSKATSLQGENSYSVVSTRNKKHASPRNPSFYASWDIAASSRVVSPAATSPESEGENPWCRCFEENVTQQAGHNCHVLR